MKGNLLLVKKIYKYLTSRSKKVYIDELDDIVNEYNNVYHRIIKMKSANAKSSTYSDFNLEKNYKDPKAEVGDHIRISKYKIIFAKGCTPNWSEEVFVIKKVKNAVPWIYVISDLNCEEIFRIFYEKELQKMNQKTLEK